MGAMLLKALAVALIWADEPKTGARVFTPDKSSLEEELK
jgi:hypothetical protein